MDEFDDDGDFDDLALQQIDAIESQFVKQTGAYNKTAHGSSVPQATEQGQQVISSSSAEDGQYVLDDELDDVLIQQIETIEQHSVPLVGSKGKTLPGIRSTALPRPGDAPAVAPRQPVASTSSSVARSLQRTSSGTLRQMTLFGEALPAQPTQGVLIQANKPNSAVGTATQQVAQRPTDAIRARAAVDSIRSIFNEPIKTTKQWDFAQPINRPRQKRRFKSDPDEMDEFEDIEDFDFNEAESDFVRPPAPEEQEVDCLTRMKVRIDREAARTWIYPTNKEKRDYQFNIVQRALFNNVLVALPTGLGKTFIAAVVILNYYRWFPEGKIIFVAPTKPLVAQQQVACHGICGLPWDAAIEMTGEKKAAFRAEEWKSKRIFYMTPQTFENDLCSTAVDAHEVVCVVVDEAHRATGNYAYGKVIRHLMQRNPFFRVLALSATPGSNSDKVQEVVDSLHINLIEVRQEDAIDIRKYVHLKEEDPVVVPMGGLVGELRDLLAKLMRPSLDILIGAGLLHERDPSSLTSFGVRHVYKDARKREVVTRRKLYGKVSELADLAHSMEHLIKYSVSMFASKMFELETGVTQKGTRASVKRVKAKYQTNSIVYQMRKRYEECQDEEGIVPHPKMDYLQNVVAAHFARYEQGENPEARETRVMVFCSLRACVTEIVTLLNRVKSVKATQFIGQATDKKGNRGLRQREQEKVVDDFKRGDINVLVATSIGEEGLDIGEVDLIVCYEAVKNSVRMLQRVGRTGRKRDGRIVVLMSEGPEERNWQQSKDQHKTIQHDIIKGINLSLYDDVERLVPPDITSEVIEMEVDQPPFEPSMIRDAAKEKRGAAKRKRNSDPTRNMPAGAELGFVAVSKLRKGKATTKGRAKKQKEVVREGEEEEEGEPSSRSLLDEHLLPVLDSLSESESSDGFLERDLEFSRQRQTNISSGRAKETSDAALTSRAAQGKASDDVLSNERTLQDDVVESFAVQRAPLLETTKQQRLATATTKNGVKGTAQNSSPGVVTALARSSSPVNARRRRPTARSIAIENSAQGKDEAGSSEDGALMSSDEESPAVHRQRKATFRRPTRKVSSSSPPPDGDMGPPTIPVSASKAQNALRATSVSKTNNSKRKGGEQTKKRRIGDSPRSRKLFQFEADRSTDEERHGEKDEDDEGDDRYQEDSSDREHVGDFAPTQAPKGYRQQAVYLQSLNTQTAPIAFRKSSLPKRQAVSPLFRRARAAMSSSSARYEQSGDEYEKGSFICSDEDVAFDTDVDASQSLDLSF